MARDVSAFTQPVITEQAAVMHDNGGVKLGVVKSKSRPSDQQNNATETGKRSLKDATLIVFLTVVLLWVFGGIVFKDARL